MNYSINTKCVQAGYTPGNGEPRQIPIIQSTTFKYDTSEDMGKLFDLEASGYFYTRLQNPTNDYVASKIAALEGGTAAMLTSSGQAANFFALFNICEAGSGICYKDMESLKAWPDGFIVRELSRMPSNFRCEDTIQKFLVDNNIPGIAGIDTRALAKILREKGTMNGMITTNENYNLEEVLPKIKEYTVSGVVKKVTCKEKSVLNGDGFKVALLDFGAKKNIARSLNNRGCEVTIYPAETKAEEILASNPDGIMLSNGPGDPKECTEIIEELKKLYASDVPMFAICLGHQLMACLLYTSPSPRD